MGRNKDTETETEITDEQIEALRYEAGIAGDAEQVRICRAALAGDEDARRECAEVIAEAAGRHRD